MHKKQPGDQEVERYCQGVVAQIKDKFLWKRDIVLGEAGHRATSFRSDWWSGLVGGMVSHVSLSRLSACSLSEGMSAQHRGALLRMQGQGDRSHCMVPPSKPARDGRVQAIGNRHQKGVVK